MINVSLYTLNSLLDPSGMPKVYARAQQTEVVSFDKLCAHIAEHNRVFSRGTVKGVVSDTCLCLAEFLLNGARVQFGELGEFFATVTCTGAESMKKFSVRNITSVNINFRPSDEFDERLQKAEFQVVPTRVAVAATLKAEKEGADVVNLAEAKAAAYGKDYEELPEDDNAGTGDSGSSDTGDDNGNVNGNEGGDTGGDDTDSGDGGIG